MFSKTQVSGSAKSLSQSRCNINRTFLSEIFFYLHSDDIVLRFWLEFLFSRGRLFDISFHRAAPGDANVFPSSAKARIDAEAVGDAGARMRQGLSQWCDSVIVGPIVISLAALVVRSPSATGRASDSSQTRFTCDMRGVAVAVASFVIRDRGTIRLRQYDRDVRAT